MNSLLSFQILGNDSGWPYLFAITAIIGGIQLCLLPFCPESPRYLISIKNDEDSAKTSMIFYNVFWCKVKFRKINNQASTFQGCY